MHAQAIRRTRFTIPLRQRLRRALQRLQAARLTPRWQDVAGYAAVSAWWLLSAIVLVCWLYAADRLPQPWGVR